MKTRLMYTNLQYLLPPTTQFACFMYPTTQLLLSEMFVCDCTWGNVTTWKDPVRSERVAGRHRWVITAMGAACAINLVLSTSVCRKRIPFNNTQGIKTPSQIIVIEEQSLCNEKNVHTHVRTHREEIVSCTGTTMIVTYWEVGDLPNWLAQFPWNDSNAVPDNPGCSTVPAQSGLCQWVDSNTEPNPPGCSRVPAQSGLCRSDHWHRGPDTL